ncbi:WRKY transcription factor SUSIBA2-like [Typha angustifolia]|uniref:WRKY transcription factor SUSIBA2-like n=1 Tax=Typha angustifolia TaxID=59011 RepID=UPI003C300702
MAETSEAKGGDLDGGSPERRSRAPDLRFEGFVGGSREERVGKVDPRVSSLAAGANAARYKSMSPARLPITREPCLTIPPGFSPSALLESPVLLTNMKAEPSPTTGTLNMSFFMNKIVRSDTLSSPRKTSFSPYDNGSSGDFEFKPHLGSSLQSAVPTEQPPEPAGPNLQQHEPFVQIQSQNKNHTCQLVSPENKALSSHELTLSVTAPSQPVESSAVCTNEHAEISSDELRKMDGSEKSMQTYQSALNGTSSLNVSEKSAEDGYNWRKYGQKHVKGSENPRSYYKCTHPNCQVKKQLERSHNGQITEIIYKGEHDHPKPQTNRRLAVGAYLSSQGEEKSDGLIIAEDNSSNALDHLPNQVNPISEPSPGSASDDDIDTGGGQLNTNDEVAADDDPDSKRRKIDTTSIDAAAMGKTNREPRVVVQTVSEVDILDDGYRWRKYGQKIVKGNPNPRSYYKCTNAGCPVRKHVERASHDPKAVITTYEGKHNHDVPAARTAGHGMSAPMVMSGINPINHHISAALSGMLATTNPHQYMQPEESDTISLDLGVGISPDHNTTANEMQSSAVDNLQHEMRSASNPYSRMAIPTIPISTLHGDPNNRIYGSREDKGEGFTFKAMPINHSSNLHYTSTGNLVLGP